MQEKCITYRTEIVPETLKMIKNTHQISVICIYFIRNVGMESTVFLGLIQIKISRGQVCVNRSTNFKFQIIILIRFIVFIFTNASR